MTKLIIQYQRKNNKFIKTGLRKSCMFISTQTKAHQANIDNINI